MELEELKSRLDVSDVLYSKTELTEIFEARTKRAVNRINRKMWWDALLMIFTAATLIAATFLIGLRDRYLISGEIFLLSAALFIHYRIKYHLLNHLDFEIEINKAVARVQNRLKIYLLAYQIMIPVSAAIVYLNIQLNLVAIIQPGLLEKVIRFGFAVPLLTAIYAITRKLIVLIYSAELKKLDEIIKEVAS